ncbi:hypothetical protein CU044_3674 [Streptomyces sp. L-9-10]|nr:hypothetical protein CU044_3674 [Streptomyces sp. L-9-10]
MFRASHVLCGTSRRVVHTSAATEGTAGPAPLPRAESEF